MRRPRFLDYYRQFEAISPEEDSQRLRVRRDEQKSRDLELAPPLDLSRSDWHEPPDPEVVNAATYALRRSLNRYPAADSAPARAAVADRHGLAREQIVVGHGAGQLLQGAVRSLAAGGEVLLPWPAWNALPALILRSGGRPVPLAGGLEGVAAAAGPDTRAVVVCSPNDPTGELVTHGALRDLAAALPHTVTILLDEALVEFAGEDASAVTLVDEIPNLLVFRSFSKAWAMAGLRAGYAAGPRAEASLLAGLGPGLGVATPAQFAVVAALEGEGRARRRMKEGCRRVAAERERLAGRAGRSGFTCSESSAHVVWMRHERLGAREVTDALADQRILVAPGTGWNDDEHVRVTLRDRAATERLLSALASL